MFSKFIKNTKKFKAKRAFTTQTVQATEHLLNIKSKRLMDENGNTALHHAAKLAIVSQDFCKYFNNENGEDVSVMSRTINDNGELPCNILEKNSNLSLSEMVRSCNALVPYMIQNEIKLAIDSPINTAEVVGRYSYLSDIQLTENMKFSCEIVNETRGIIKYSTTHPTANSYTNQQLKKTHADIESIRNQPMTLINSPFGIKLIAQSIAKNQSGNCMESSIFSVFATVEKNKLMSATGYYFVNSDHVFTAVEFPESKHRIIIDSWAGEAYLVDEMNDRLNGFKYFEGNDEQPDMRVITNYNPKFHLFAPVFKLNNTVVLPENSRKISRSF